MIENFIALDLEMNQPSNKIIQVGYVVGNLKSGEILHRARHYVIIDEPLAQEITQLTGIDEEALANWGESLQDTYMAIRGIREKYSCFRNPITWGGGDSECLRQQLGLNEREFVFGRRWLDAKTLFVSYCLANNIKYQSGLSKSMVRLGLSFQGRKHDALCDAENTFRVYRTLLGKLQIKPGIIVSPGGKEL